MWRIINQISNETIQKKTQSSRSLQASANPCSGIWLLKLPPSKSLLATVGNQFGNIYSAEFSSKTNVFKWNNCLGCSHVPKSNIFLDQYCFQSIYTHHLLTKKYFILRSDIIPYFHCGSFKKKKLKNRYWPWNCTFCPGVNI